MPACVRSFRLLLVFGFLLVSRTTFAVRVSAISDEWVVTLRLENRQEENSLPVFPNHKIISRFGTEGRFLLLRGKEPPQRVRGVAAIQPNYYYRSSDASDPEFEKSWGLENTGQVVGQSVAGIAGADTNVKPAWAITQGSRDVIVAILDSGVDVNHADLKRNLWHNLKEIPQNHIDDEGNGFVDDVDGWNFVDGNANIQDDFHHGTFCAGIIGAEGGNGIGSRGVNWKVSMMPLKVLDSGGGGSTATTVQAIEYAVKQGATVINASWGGTTHDQALYDAIQSAGRKGVLFVTVSGNDSKNNDTDSSPTYPGSYRLPSLISVSAYDNRNVMASFSNFGAKTVDIGAPGVDIYSTWLGGGYKFSEGTSYAAPFVSGAVALLRAAEPNLTLDELKKRVMETSSPLDYYGRHQNVSGGRLNIGNLLQDVRPPRPAEPKNWTEHVYSASSAHPYANNTTLNFTVREPGATHLRIHFKTFSTESCCDHVVLRDSKSRQVASYSGALGSFWTDDALGDVLTVEFKSDYGVTANGFDVDSYAANYERLREEFEDEFSARWLLEGLFTPLPFNPGFHRWPIEAGGRKVSLKVKEPIFFLP